MITSAHFFYTNSANFKKAEQEAGWKVLIKLEYTTCDLILWVISLWTTIPGQNVWQMHFNNSIKNIFQWIPEFVLYQKTIL